MYFITTKRMLEVCFSAHPNIQYRTFFVYLISTAKQKAAAQYTAAFYVLILSYNPLFTLAVMIFGKILHNRYIFR